MHRNMRRVAKSNALVEVVVVVVLEDLVVTFRGLAAVQHSPSLSLSLSQSGHRLTLTLKLSRLRIKHNRERLGVAKEHGLV